MWHDQVSNPVPLVPIALRGQAQTWNLFFFSFLEINVKPLQNHMEKISSVPNNFLSAEGISDNIARQVKLTPDAFGSLRHVRRIHQVAAFEKCPQARKKD